MKPYTQHETAIVESEHIGAGTQIAAFAHILPGASIGEKCRICDYTFIENDVVIGDRVTIEPGVQLWDGVTLEDDVFVGPGVCFTNVTFPRNQSTEPYLRTVVKKGASIGANATLLPGITIGREAMVGAGAVVTKDVPPHAIVVGNPARIQGYGPANRHLPTAPGPAQDHQRDLPDLGVAGAKIYELPLITDLRGSLTFGEIGAQLPFEPKRYFMVFDVPSKDVRGEHAHLTLHQFLICVHGSCSVVVDDGQRQAEVTLDCPNIGLHVPPMVWAIQYKYTPDTVLLVLASDVYKAEDYIRDYDRFLELVNKQ